MPKKGFTLIELLVVMAVMTTLSGFGVSSYLNFNERQTLEQAGKTLKNDLRLTQNNALSGKVWDEGDPDCAGKYLTGWCFSPQESQESEDSYKLYGGCAPLPVPDSYVNTFNEKDTVLPKGIRILTYDESRNLITSQYNKILFKTSADERVNIYNSASGKVGSVGSIVYCLESSIPLLVNLAYKITVTSGGDIKDYGVVSSSNCPE